MNAMTPTPKPPKRILNGVLLLDKPDGVSSNTALQQARRLYRAQKAGHTGVLDPLATGLLPVCFGEATKFAQYLLDADKAYTATLKLGQQTSTGDAEGEVIATAAANIKPTDLQAAITALSGPIRQVPPMYSALKHQGRALYEYARQGIEIERKARDVTIHAIEVLQFAPPLLQLAVRCSKGTYIRTWAEDLAKQMGTLAHLTGLRRTATAGFGIEQSHTLADLAACSEAERDSLLLPCDALVQHLPAICLDADSILRLQQGKAVQAQAVYGTMSPLRVYGPSQAFIGLVHFEAASGCLKVTRLMNTAANAAA